MPARRVLMVDPNGFRANPETADDNAFQRGTGEPDPEVEAAARAEFERLRAVLESRGIAVDVATPPDAATPDAVFPNNWFTTHADGTLVLYPMRAPSRRLERRPEFLAVLRDRYPKVVDFSREEGCGRFLEGTGSLVVDESSRIAYASVSARTDPELVAAWAERLGYNPVVFTARDKDGREVYHTNVVMAIGDAWAVVCADAIDDDADRGEVLATLAETGHETIPLSLPQMHAFCGNVLELSNAEGDRFVVMSETARKAYRPEQIAILERHAGILAVDLSTIETHGGGSARCMLAELH